MFKPKRPKIRILPSIHERPPTIDTEATRNEESSAATGEIKEGLQASKAMPALSLTEMVKQRTQENRQLRRELAYQHRKQGASIYFLEEVRIAVDSFQEAVVRFQKLLGFWVPVDDDSLYWYMSNKLPIYFVWVMCPTCREHSPYGDVPTAQSAYSDDLTTSDVQDHLKDVIENAQLKADYPIEVYTKIYINKVLTKRRSLPDTTRDNFNLSDIEDNLA
ncbi:MAG: hypothetical protein M1839_006368 [Geoglossum umbratile]|nr:MAG: hypothetical protein M1839_006368 [Geoglossum umbratile]